MTSFSIADFVCHSLHLVLVLVVGLAGEGVVVGVDVGWCW